MKRSHDSLRVRGRQAALAGTVLVCVSPALLQAQAADQLEELVVTASRVNRSGFSAPTPTTMLGEEELRLSGRSNIADSLNDVPSFKASSTPVTGGLSSQTPGGSFLNLRALGANRTLVLVDGRRHVPTTSSGLVDLNVVPGALIERVEVVTGGASAAWGSDAVAGVVNLIFDKELQGIKAEVQGGLSNESDNRDIKASLAGGTAFADGRGHIVAAVEASDNEGVLDQRDRSWGARDWQLIAYRDDNGDIKRLITPNAHLATATEGGLITTGCTRVRSSCPVALRRRSHTALRAAPAT